MSKDMEATITNDKVRYSRAGDAFHYRWAARRCLKMLYPLSPIKSIVIEGSKESKLAGEYTIDLAEYYSSGENNDGINYYQLKHTTVQKDNPFQLSDLKDTILGFAKRYKEHISRKDERTIEFFLVTNRKIHDVFKDRVRMVKNNEECEKRFSDTFKKYTELENANLVDFCKRLKFLDGLGDFQEQWSELYYDVTKLLAGNIGHTQIDTITALVAEKALPSSNGEICVEEILKRFGCTSKRDLYPAPIELETLNTTIIRCQYIDISNKIIQSKEPVIVHAAGGVGKSVFAMTLKDLLPKDSVTIIYDCFGLGKYRNRTQTRHRYRDGIVQISNELAGKGLCDPLIALSTNLDDEILRSFLERLKIAIQNIRHGYENGQLFIIIDAADNAEMAAKEFGDNCFIHELLREDLPEHCHLVMLCRTERIDLLKPKNSIKKFELLPFTEDETFDHLNNHFQDIAKEVGVEFHRLTNGNPRVQANAIAWGNGNLIDILKNLGPTGTTVEKQIEHQLNRAIEKIKDSLTNDYQEQIDAICCGLASLPPFIPISVLAVAAKVEESTIRSFISDLGRPIWILDSVIQFRDEPSEKWFRDNYFGTVTQVREYITRLKPLANHFTYIAEVLPVLYLQGEYYKELVELALSDECLPKENPIDRRNVQLFRLQYAFRAALRSKQYYDASKLAMLAGEETAGNERQKEIFRKNIDLIAPLQDTQKVQELAFKRNISAAWRGSENVYSASLLSNISEYQGEARAYLRAAENWLNLYFKEREKNKDKGNRTPLDTLHKEEIIELVFAYYNLGGIRYAVKYMIAWKPELLVFEIVSGFTKKLIDLGRFQDIEEIGALTYANIYAILAINNELLKVGHFLEKTSLEKCLSKLDINNLKMPNLDGASFDDDNNKLAALLAFAEACVASCFDSEKIIKLLDKFIPMRAPVTFASNYRNKDRIVFLRAVALRKYLNLYSNQKENEWIPEKFADGKLNYKDKEDAKNFIEVYSGLIPWYTTRLIVLLGNYDKFDNIIKESHDKTEGVLRTRYMKYDNLSFEIAQICVEILFFCRKASSVEIKSFYENRIQSCDTLWMDSRIQALRGVNRLDFLKEIQNNLEEFVYNSIKQSDDTTETKSEYFVELARATIPISTADAAVYFNMAIMEVSRFGDELPSRWKAVSSIAKKCVEKYNDEAELSYRFIRCAELVGDNVAREKYWSRDEAIELCTQLSPASGLTAISRWRERNIGWFENQFPIVVDAIIKSGYIRPEVAWSLSAFIKDSSMLDLAISCIKYSQSEKIIKRIVEVTIKYFRILNMPISLWDKLKIFLDESKIESNEVAEICEILEKNTYEKVKQLDSQSELKHHVITEDEKHYIFDGLDVMNTSDIVKIITRFKSIKDSYYNKNFFWETFFSKVPQGNIVEFMENFIKLPIMDFYKLRNALPHLPKDWMKRPSFARKWPAIIKIIANIYARDLLGYYSKSSFFSEVKFSNDEIRIITEGVVEGLTRQENINTSDEYFDFVATIQEMITPSQAKSLLEFSLSRFESNIDEDFGDGNWSKWLIPSCTPEINFAGFIWSALGSPEAETRWDAVHATKRLAEFDCVNEIKTLLMWAGKNTVDCFGSNKFPFYNLNAHLYLLIALDRISLENPKILLQYAAVFSQYVNWNIPHVLIQRKALSIVKNIEKSFPGTYNNLNKMILIEKSQFPLYIVDYRGKIKHTDNETEIEEEHHEEDIKFYHGYDFDRYWFEPLAKIFGISGKTVENLASEVIINEWKISYDGSYNQDPRHSLWESRKFEQKTWHSHEQYPKVERYNFYLSYHAMFVVAARLFQKMPIVFEKDYDEIDPWTEWIDQHSLTRPDGFLLSDTRGSVPFKRPVWMKKQKEKDWRRNISANEFLDNIVMDDGRVCVSGHWVNVQDSYKETIAIASALVSRETSQALLSALISCKNSHDYKIPDYNEEEMQYEDELFILQGWIKDDSVKDGLDRFDFWAGGISFPSYELGEIYQELLGLEVNKLKNMWYKESNTVHVICENWSILENEYGERDPLRGSRMLATLDILKELCKSTSMNLVLEIQISRSIVRDKYSNNVADDEYMPPVHKIYLLSEQGVLSDEHGNIEFG